MNETTMTEGEAAMTASIIRSIADSIEPAFPTAADLLRGIATRECFSKHASLVEDPADVDRRVKAYAALIRGAEQHTTEEEQ